MEQLMSFDEASNALQVSKSTLRRWDYEGKLVAFRTAGGHRRYKYSDIQKFIGNEDINTDSSVDESEIKVATYARVSTFDQKQHGDLDRQSQRLVEYAVSHNYKITNIIKDIGSGINDCRKGFRQLCKLVTERKINKVIIEHKDRLTRFQFNLIEFFFKTYDVDVVLLDTKEYTPKEELVNDMMMLLASFSGRMYSARAKENKKKLS